MPTGIYPRKQEYRDAIRDGLRESKKKIGRPKGSQQSADARRKISEAVKARVYTPEIKARMSLAAQKRQRLHPSAVQRKGFKHSEETKRKMSEKASKRTWTPEQRQAHSGRMKGTATHTSVGQKRVMEKLERAGCKVLQRGWPDLLIVDPDGKVRAVEVKRPGGSLSADQVVVFDILRSIGLTVEVIHESNKKEQQCAL